MNKRYGASYLFIYLKVEFAHKIKNDVEQALKDSELLVEKYT